MAELNINKSAFGVCYDALKELSTRLREASNFSIEASGDTSMTGKKEQECYDELVNMINDLAALADETAQDVRLTQARYVLADQQVGGLWQLDIIQKRLMSKSCGPSSR